MPISKDFSKYKEDYIDLDDFFDGERRVKEKGDRYTPKLEGHIDKPTLYAQYKAFGILYNVLHRTRQGLKGAIVRKPLDIDFPEGKKELLDDIMITGASFNDLSREVCDDVIGYGRCGALVDIYEDTQLPYVAFYKTMSILDWPKSKKDKQEITLQEMIEETNSDDELVEIEQRRKLELDGAGRYCVSVYRKASDTDDTWVLHEGPIYPKYKGKTLDYIPFVFFGSSNNTPEPSRPPLLDLLSLSKGHWKLTVAYQYALNLTGLPTPCFAGFEFEEGAVTPLGSGASYHTADAQAKSWFLQTGGSGLAEMEHGLDRIEKQMAVVGARLLEEQKSGVEAAETIKVRSSGDSATLADIAGNIENGLTKVLKYVGALVGITEKVRCGVNKDFVSARLSPQDITALLAAVQSGNMSVETFLWNLQQGETLQPGRSIEEEQEAIAEDKIKQQREAPALQFGAIGSQTLPGT